MTNQIQKSLTVRLFEAENQLDLLNFALESMLTLEKSNYHSKDYYKTIINKLTSEIKTINLFTNVSCEAEQETE